MLNMHDFKETLDMKSVGFNFTMFRMHSGSEAGDYVM